MNKLCELLSNLTPEQAHVFTVHLGRKFLPKWIDVYSSLWRLPRLTAAVVVLATAYAWHKECGNQGVVECAYELYQAIYRDGRVFPSQWKTPTVLSLQQVAKDDLTLFPILADALEDAGCGDQEILCHLRQRNDLWTPADWCLNNTGATNE